MNDNDFYKQVLAQIRHATANEKASIRLELQNHVEDHVKTLIDAGIPQEDCMEQAISAMGDPQEIGKELNKQYPLRWLFLSRVSLILCLLLGFSMLGTFPLLSHVYDNLQARYAPDDSSIGPAWSDMALTTYPLDIKVPIGNDVVSIYKASLHGDKETGYLISIAMCNYDPNPFGIASTSLLHSLKVETSTQTYEGWNGGGGGSAGVYYWVIQSLPVTEADAEVYLCYEHFGEEIRIAVPIPWEVLA